MCPRSGFGGPGTSVCHNYPFGNHPFANLGTVTAIPLHPPMLLRGSLACRQNLFQGVEVPQKPCLRNLPGPSSRHQRRCWIESLDSLDAGIFCIACWLWVGPPHTENANPRSSSARKNWSPIGQPAPKYHTKGCSHSSQRKTKGATTKGQNRFRIFHTFSHTFSEFSPRTFPFKTKGFSSMRTKEKKDKKKKRDKSMLHVGCCTFVLLLSSADSPGARTLVFAAFEPLAVNFRRQ